MKATDLPEVYRLFDPQEPLKGKKLKEFYMERETPILRIRNELLNSIDKPLKILFAGTRGNGKITELNRLAEDKDIRKDIEVVFFSVKDELDVLDIKHTDILLIIGTRIYETFEKHKEIRLQRAIKKELDDWSEKIVETVKEKQKGIEVGGGFRAIIQLAAKFKDEATTRETSRKIIEPRLSDLISIINKMIFDIEDKLKKKILVIIDDLDKLNPGPAEELFYSYVRTLTAPLCHVIYTFPVSISFSPTFSQVKRFFDSDYHLPNINLTDKKGNEIRKNHTLLKNLALKRFNERLITKAAFKMAVQISGGIFHDFIRNIREAANEADARGEKKIEKRDVAAVKQKLINDYSRVIDEKDKEILRKVMETKEKTNGEIFRKLLFNLAIVEYGNGEGLCYDVHPAVQELIK